jgi:hypothetical protein
MAMSPEGDAPGSAAARLEEAGLKDRIDPHLAPFFETWLDVFIFHGRLDPQFRELAILRIMWRCDAVSEWGSHYRLARQAGLTRDEILAIRSGDPERDLTGMAGLAARSGDDVVDSGCLGAETMTLVYETLLDGALADEFLFLLAGYRMFASVSASKREPYSEIRSPWPPDGVGPGQTIS